MIHNFGVTGMCLSNMTLHTVVDDIIEQRLVKEFFEFSLFQPLIRYDMLSMTFRLSFYVDSNKIITTLLERDVY